MIRFRLLLVTLVAALTLQSCGGGDDSADTGTVTDTNAAAPAGETAATEATGATVEKIVLSKDEGGSAGDETETIAPSDQTFHATVHVDKEALSNAKVKVDLIAVETAEGNNVPVISQDYEIGGINNQVDVKFSLPNPWPVGKYRVDAYIDGTLAKSREFMIEG